MHESIMHVILAMLSFKRNHTSITFKGKYKCKRLIKLPLLLYMLCDIIYMILNISSTISTSVNFVAIKSKTIADLSYVICKCSIKIWTTIHVCDFGTYLTWEMHRLISHADAVELEFVFIYIYKQQMLLCLMTYFYRLAWAFIAELKSNVLTNLIFYKRYYLSSI